MIVKQVEVGPMKNFSYIVGDKKTKETVIIDPGWEIEKLIEYTKELNLKITKVLLTHTHYDHCQEAVNLAKLTGAILFVNHLEKSIPKIEKISLIKDGEIINLGNLKIKCIHAPGHTPGATCYLIENSLFTGDVLFVNSIGRTDLVGGNEKEMKDSLLKLSKLNKDILIYSGHDYGYKKVSTIKEELKENPHLKFIKNHQIY